MKKYDIVKMVQSLATVISAGALLSKDNPGSAKQASTDLEKSSWEFWLQTSATAIQVLSFAYYRWDESKSNNSKSAASLDIDHTDGSGDETEYRAVDEGGEATKKAEEKITEYSEPFTVGLAAAGAAIGGITIGAYAAGVYASVAVLAGNVINASAHGILAAYNYCAEKCGKKQDQTQSASATGASTMFQPVIAAAENPAAAAAPGATPSAPPPPSGTDGRKYTTMGNHN